MSKAKDRLPSITTIDCTYYSERSGAPSSTVIDDETIPNKVEEMLGFTRMNGREVNEKDLQAVVKITEVLLKSYYKNEEVREMYMCYQNMWRTHVAKEQIEDKYNDNGVVNFFMKLKIDTHLKLFG